MVLYYQKYQVMNTQLNIAVEISQNNQISQLHTEFTSLLNKILSNLSEKLFNELNQDILQTFRESSQKSYKALMEIIETLVIRLANRIQSLQSLVDLEITKSDYQSLQSSLQRSQAQVRTLFKIQHQQKIYHQDLQERLNQQKLKLKQADKTINLYKSVVQKQEKEKKDMLKKIDYYQQRLYLVSRQGKYDSAEKSTQNLLLHKASLHFKQKQKHQPYLQNLSKSKNVLVRRRQNSKIIRDKGLRLLQFQSLKEKLGQVSVQRNCSISFQEKKVKAGNSFTYQELHSSIQMKDPIKKRKNRVLKNLTQMNEL